MFRHKFYSVWCATLLVPVAVGFAPASAFAEPVVENLTYALEGALWKVQQIAVCWENLGSKFTQERGWVQEQINQSWGANSSLKFVGWAQCTNTDTNSIRIQTADAQPLVRGLGIEIRGKENGMVLNFTFSNFSKDYCQTRRQHCIRAVAMHEFGHALGFAHEQNRADAPDWCQKERQGTNGDMMMTDFDLKSVMNYCSNSSWPEDAVLSAFDIVGLQRIYGPPGGAISLNPGAKAVSLKAQHNNCDNIQGSRSAPCVAAMHRVCMSNDRGDAGISQEVNARKEVFGMGCMRAIYSGVPISTLQKLHSGCSSPTLGQSAECIGASRRWCDSNNMGNAAVVQEADSAALGIACIKESFVATVTIPQLTAEHSDCDRGERIQNQECVAAIHRWCVKSGKGILGLAQEINAPNVVIACFPASWYGEVAIQ
jgi:Astacin (Peptidase family M12A)